MTKQEFDAQMKTNYGQRMPSDTREHYRASQCRAGGEDQLATRAAYGTQRARWFGSAGALTAGSKLRAGMKYRYKSA